MRQRDPGLEWVNADPLMNPLCKEPRFQAGRSVLTGQVVNPRPVSRHCQRALTAAFAGIAAAP
jgi:hypothetical protein